MKATLGSAKRQARSRSSQGSSDFGVTEVLREVYTAIIPKAHTESLLPIIEERVEPDSTVYTDMFWAYNALDASDFHHHKIDYSRLFAKQGYRING